jgi:exopolysaccharide production repressor protein
MSAPKFIIGMLMVVAIVTVWSLLDAAPWGTVLLRAIAAAVILQVGYFLIVLFLVGRQPSRQLKATPAKSLQDTSAKLPGERHMPR